MDLCPVYSDCLNWLHHVVAFFYLLEMFFFSCVPLLTVCEIINRMNIQKAGTADETSSDLRFYSRLPAECIFLKGRSRLRVIGKPLCMGSRPAAIVQPAFAVKMSPSSGTAAGIASIHTDAFSSHRRGSLGVCRSVLEQLLFAFAPPPSRSAQRSSPPTFNVLRLSTLTRTKISRGSAGRRGRTCTSRVARASPLLLVVEDEL